MADTTFLWHDYETFGANPRYDRPAQFAAIRTDAELNDEGNAFALAYFEGRKNESAYIEDYLDTFEAYETVYHVPDSWAAYDAIAPFIHEQYREWVAARRPKYILL